MPIRDYPFTVTRPGDAPRPYLPVTIVNPITKKRLSVFALIDTGADECAFPASFAPLLGHDLQAGQQKKISTGNGTTTAYGHTSRLEIAGFETQEVVVDFMPNLFIPLLGVRSFLTNFVLTVDYPQATRQYSSPFARKLFARQKDNMILQTFLQNPRGRGVMSRVKT